MALRRLDPNRYATGVEAADVSARSRVELATVAIATERRQLAQQSLRAARERFSDAEAAYQLYKAALDDATAYDALAETQLQSSVEQLAAARALLHPVRKTPLELLGTIFGYCLEDLPEDGSSLEGDEAQVRLRQGQPFRLAAVCRRWRQASLSFPAAWSTLELLLDGEPHNNQAWLAYIACTISRSASAPIDIRISRTRGHREDDRALIAPIQQNMSRCSSLHIFANIIRDASDALVPLLGSPSPLLRVLHLITLIDRPAYLSSLALSPAFPNLEYLHARAPLCASQPPFAALVDVVLFAPMVSSTPARDDIAALAHMAPNLDMLTLVHCAADTIVHHEPLVLPATRLCITHTDDDREGVEFVRQCKFPRLDWLKLCGHAAGSGERVRMLSAILPHSPALASLRLSSVAAADVPALCLALRLANALTELAIRKTDLAHASLRLLCDALGQPGEQARWTCPALTVLEFDACTFAPDCAMDDLVQLVSRRLGAASAPREEGKVRPARMRALRLPEDAHRALAAQLSALVSRKASS